jgi:hypothetical protein
MTAKDSESKSLIAELAKAEMGKGLAAFKFKFWAGWGGGIQYPELHEGLASALSQSVHSCSTD